MRRARSICCSCYIVDPERLYYSSPGACSILVEYSGARLRQTYEWRDGRQVPSADVDYFPPLAVSPPAALLPRRLAESLLTTAEARCRQVALHRALFAFVHPSPHPNHPTMSCCIDCVKIISTMACLSVLADAMTRGREYFQTVTAGVRSDSFCAAIWRIATAT